MERLDSGSGPGVTNMGGGPVQSPLPKVQRGRKVWNGPIDGPGVTDGAGNWEWWFYLDTSILRHLDTGLRHYPASPSRRVPVSCGS